MQRPNLHPPPCPHPPQSSSALQSLAHPTSPSLPPMQMLGMLYSSHGSVRLQNAQSRAGGWGSAWHIPWFV